MRVQQLTLNGQTVAIDPQPGETLLMFLRNAAGLRATRQGCGTGHCGACTVLVDGLAAQSCQLALGGVAGATVETLESVRDTPTGRRIVAALTRHRAAQCGYCLPGIVMAAQAVLAGTGGAVDPIDILRRNICRCGAHPRILAALRDLTGGQQP